MITNNRYHIDNNKDSCLKPTSPNHGTLLINRHALPVDRTTPRQRDRCWPPQIHPSNTNRRFLGGRPADLKVTGETGQARIARGPLREKRGPDINCTVKRVVVICTCSCGPNRRPQSRALAVRVSSSVGGKDTLWSKWCWGGGERDRVRADCVPPPGCAQRAPTT